MNTSAIHIKLESIIRSALETADDSAAAGNLERAAFALRLARDAQELYAASGPPEKDTDPRQPPEDVSYTDMRDEWARAAGTPPDHEDETSVVSGSRTPTIDALRDLKDALDTNGGDIGSLKSISVTPGGVAALQKDMAHIVAVEMAATDGVPQVLGVEIQDGGAS